MPFTVEQRNKSLVKLIDRATQKGLNEEEASYLCKLGSVLICGNVERCVEIIIVARLAKSPKQVSNFLGKFFQKGTNFDCDRIAELLYKFDSNWGKIFEGKVTESDRISLSSCYAVRNSVAHGGGQSIGPKILRQYYDASLAVISALETAVH